MCWVQKCQVAAHTRPASTGSAGAARFATAKATAGTPVTAKGTKKPLAEEASSTIPRTAKKVATDLQSRDKSGQCSGARARRRHNQKTNTSGDKTYPIMGRPADRPYALTKSHVRAGVKAEGVATSAKAWLYPRTAQESAAIRLANNKAQTKPSTRSCFKGSQLAMLAGLECMLDSGMQLQQ